MFNLIKKFFATPAYEVAGIPVSKHELIILNREGYIFPKDIAFGTMQYVVIGYKTEPKYFETIKEAYEFIR